MASGALGSDELAHRDAVEPRPQPLVLLEGGSGDGRRLGGALRFDRGQLRDHVGLGSIEPLLRGCPPVDEIRLLLLEHRELHADGLRELHDLEQLVLERALASLERVALLHQRLQLARHRAGGELAVGVAAFVLDRRDLDLEAALTA